MDITKPAGRQVRPAPPDEAPVRCACSVATSSVFRTNLFRANSASSLWTLLLRLSSSNDCTFSLRGRAASAGVAGRTRGRPAGQANLEFHLPDPNSTGCCVLHFSVQQSTTRTLR